MDVARARSPPASLGRRPIGPRSPGRPGAVPKNIIPLDLSARLQEDVASVYASPVPTVPSSSRAASPALYSPTPDRARDSQPALSEKSIPGESVESHTTASTCTTSPSPSPTGDAVGEGPPSIRGDEDPAETPSLITIPPPEPDPWPPTPRSDGSRPPSIQMSVSAHSRSLSEKSVQVCVEPASISVAAAITQPSSSSTPASTRASTPALVRVVPKRPPLALPSTLNFEAEQIQWKAMTLEAAQWTLTSEQLQETVSRAIRHSASESFIRVVPTQTFDEELPQELERLESLKVTTQAQYRFNMHRRTMLLQSLSALSQSQYPDGGDGEALYSLTTQLAELTVSCDRLMETLVHISDQKAQIQQVQDLHIASALSMALRKLNTSYAKRTAELREERTRNEALNAELEEAWSMAQDMAQEMDDLDNFDLTFSDEEDPDNDTDLLEAEIYSDMDRMSAVASVRNAEVIEITGKAIATKATLTTLPTDDLAPGDRTSRVTAAKKRSSRTSKASLRIPKTPTGERAEKPDRSSIYSLRSRRSRSKSMRRRPDRNEAVSPADEDVPEVPIIRVPEPAPRKEGSFLELSETRPVSPAISAVSEPPPLPPSIAASADGSMGLQIISSPSEDVPPAPSDPNPPASATFDSMSIPTISLQQEPQASQPSWRSRKLFSRRIQSMQPPLRAMDDTATQPLKRSISEVKHFDGWPFLGSQKAQRFSVPVLSVIQPHRSRSSTDSAPAATSSRHSSSSTR
ncbi:hypothetical protein BC628DRAFT_1350376 [Trametes gibbosa]|nr:hypothetical protein BC628DRAFT_1350376 [Trametes gibbosa]